MAFPLSYCFQCLFQRRLLTVLEDSLWCRIGWISQYQLSEQRNGFYLSRVPPPGNFCKEGCTQHYFSRREKWYEEFRTAVWVKDKEKNDVANCQGTKAHVFRPRNRVCVGVPSGEMKNRSRKCDVSYKIASTNILAEVKARAGIPSFFQAKKHRPRLLYRLCRWYSYTWKYEIFLK